MTDLDSDAMLNLDEKTLRPPKPSRVGSVTAIRNRIGELRNNDEIRSSNRRVMSAWIFNGERPYEEQMLENLGQSDRTNFNPREAKGMADTAKTPFYSLIFRNPRFAAVTTKYGFHVERRAQWSEDISQSFHKMLDDWDEHDYNVQLYQLEMVTWGVGNTIWPDDKTWQWETRKIRDVLVPDRVKANIKKISEAAIYGTMNPVDLYKKVENEKAAKTMGWFPDRVKRALVRARPLALQTLSEFGDTWSEAYEESLRRGDISWNAGTSEIAYYSYLVQEFDGRITECIVLDDPTTAAERNDDDDALLFKRIGRYKSFEQVMCPFFFDIGMGEWHSIKGLAPDIFDNTMASARMLMDIIDGGRRGATMILQAKEAVALQATQLIGISGATVVQPGFDVVQQRLGNNLEGPMGVRRELANVVQNTTAQYVERISDENQEPTLGQAQLNARKENALNESSFDRYCKTLDRQYCEVYRRASKMGIALYKKRHPDNEVEKPESTSYKDEAQELAYQFVKRCVERDVPLEAIDYENVESVKATRGLGSGSPIGADMATQGLLQLAPMMDERGRRNAFRSRAAFLVGASNVDLYFPEFAQADLPDDNVALATLENNALRQPNGQAVVTPRQDHPIHFGVHFQDASGDVTALQQGQADPMAVLTHLHQAGPHMKAHLNAMQGDPTRKRQLEPMNKAWLALSKVTDHLQQQVEQAQKARQRNAPPQVDPQLAAALAKVQGELGIKAQKMQGDMHLKAIKEHQQMALKDIGQAHDMRLKAQLQRRLPAGSLAGMAA